MEDTCDIFDFKITDNLIPFYIKSTHDKYLHQIA